MDAAAALAAQAAASPAAVPAAMELEVAGIDGLVQVQMPGFTEMQAELACHRRLLDVIQQSMPPQAAEAMHAVTVKAASRPVSRATSSHPVASARRGEAEEALGPNGEVAEGGGEEASPIKSASVSRRASSKAGYPATQAGVAEGGSVAASPGKVRIPPSGGGLQGLLNGGSGGSLFASIEALQRTVLSTNQKMNELSTRLNHMEADLQGPILPYTTDDAEKPRGDLHHLMQQSDSVHFVSKKSLHQAVVGIREDVRNWLETLNASMVDALNRKADHEDLVFAAGQVGTVAFEASDNVAAFVKRSFNGKCASCDAPICADLNRVSPPPVVGGMQDLWPTHGSPGARFSIRPPGDGTKHMHLSGPTSSSATKLPKIQEARVSKDFPKGRVLKQGGVLRSGSSPEL